MKPLALFSPLALFLLALVPAVWAQGSDPASPLTSLPDCAVSCLASAALGSSCTITDQACLCRDAALQKEVTNCVMANCTIKEALTTKNTTDTNCQVPIRDRSGLLARITIVLGTITGVTVLGRIVFKTLVAKLGMAWDDWAVLATTITGVPNTVIGVHGTTANGLGRDVWTLPFATVTRFGFFFYLMEVFYFVEVTLLKVSILLFYLRIFPSRGTRRLLWGTLAFDGLVGLAFIFASVFQCTPVSYFWTKWDGEHSGTCVNINALGWANAIISIVMDIWMLGIPLSQLPRLNLHWKKKVGVGMMFCVGTFVTVVSILRLQSLVSFANSQNPTWDNWNVTNWSTVEINVGIMCACMPTVRLALVRAFPILGGSTARSAAYGYRSGGGTSSGTGRRNRPVLASASTGRGAETDGDMDLGGVGRGGIARGGGGIKYQKSFMVQYSDHDEASLVHMRDLDLGESGERTTGRATSESS